MFYAISYFTLISLLLVISLKYFSCGVPTNILKNPQKLPRHWLGISIIKKGKSITNYFENFRFLWEGLVFTITIVQWAVEVSHMIFIIIYMSLQFGKSGIVDRCFANFNAFVGIVLQPFCIFMGDSSFRRRLQEDGLLFALRKELF